MNYNHLFYFQTLAELENYHKAAQQLHITQPSLSNAIHNIEAELGVQLFQKKGRGVTLTVQGIRYLDYVNRAIKNLNEGELMLSYELASSNFFLSMGYVMSVSYDFVPELMKGYKKASGKNIFFSCIHNTSDKLAKELLNGNVSLIISANLNDPRIEQKTLFKKDPILLTPKNHPLANRKSVHINELNGEAFIAHNRNTSFHKIMSEIYLRTKTHVRIVSEAAEDRAILGMVKAGFGCAVVLDSPEIHGSDFSAIPLVGSGFQGEICIGKRANSVLPPETEEFYQFVLNYKY